LLALAASIALAAYLVIPELLYRMVLGRFLPLRSVLRSRSEELGRALFSIAVPFFIALLLVHYIPGFRSWPGHDPGEHIFRVADYKLLCSSMLNEKVFENNESLFYVALHRSAFRQLHFIFWYYTIVMAEAGLMGLAARFYGRLRSHKTKPVAFLVLVIEQILIPKISEWELLLTPFTLASPKSRVQVDILMTNGTLYQGFVFKHYLDSAGRLAGLIITEPRRYNRQQLLKDREQGAAKRTDTYWREIPSRQMYLLADKILNINVNYAAATTPKSVADFVQEIAARPLPTLSVTIIPPPKKTP
jgi:hypothetical protein